MKSLPLPAAAPLAAASIAPAQAQSTSAGSSFVPHTTSGYIGPGFDVNSNVGVVLQWDRHRMKFAGQGRRDVEAASLGVIYRF